MARRDQLSRLLAVAHALRRTRIGLPLRVLAERHGWNLRAVYRDVAALEAAGYPVVNEDGKYRLLESALPSAPGLLDAEERLALLVARRASAGWGVTSIGRALDRVWAKVTATDGQSALPLPAGPGWLTLRSAGGIDYAARRSMVAALERAVRQRVAVRCTYRAVSSGEETTRVIEPGELHWDPVLESLYCIAWCRLREDVRVFAVHRFTSVVATEESFAARSETRSSVALRDAFRVWRGAAVSRVRVRFFGMAAREVTERQWHASQRVERAADGAVEVSFEVAGYDEVVRWVLGFGEEAVVLEPAALRRTVAEGHARAAARYEEAPGVARPRGRAPAVGKKIVTM